MDAISFLKEQHAEVNGLMMKLERARDSTLRAQIFRTIDDSLRTHALLEERIFYPEFKFRTRSDSDRRHVDESLREHADVKAALEDLEAADPAGDAFARTSALLKELVKQHVREEEEGMLKRSLEIFDAAQREDLGFRMEEYMRLLSPVYDMRQA